MSYFKYILFSFLILFSCSNKSATSKENKKKYKVIYEVKLGNSLLNDYLELIENKSIGVCANNTSVINKNVHLIDSLISLGIDVKAIFSPEHGFFGEKGAGEHIDNNVYGEGKIPVFSLYGQNKKPERSSLSGLDIVLFDMQDVGVRFYTYISTMHFLMEACAENNVKLIILDRPNPNGFYVDGPVLDTKYASFVGMHPVPLVHGMTMGEYARMINGEGWLKDGINCNLTVIKCKGYNHNTRYKPSVPPSPNLQTDKSIYLYPSLGLFEGTVVSVGRGTKFPFMVYGHPDFNSSFSFKPESIPGVSQNPKFEGENCFGYDLRKFNETDFFDNPEINLKYLINSYKELKGGDDFFNSFFYKLAGTKKLKKQIEIGVPESEIKASWQKDLYEFREIRKKYLLYEDFE